MATPVCAWLDERLQHRGLKARSQLQDIRGDPDVDVADVQVDISRPLGHIH